MAQLMGHVQINRIVHRLRGAVERADEAVYHPVRRFHAGAGADLHKGNRQIQLRVFRRPRLLEAQNDLLAYFFPEHRLRAEQRKAAVSQIEHAAERKRRDLYESNL